MRPRLFATAAAIALAAAACSSDTSDTSPAPTTADSSAATDAPSASDPTSDVAEPAAGVGLVAADGWSATEVGAGIKPDLALDAEGAPAIAWLVEKEDEGFVSYAAEAEGWIEDRFIEGYFYGPIGLDFDAAGNPHIAYHDHQDTTFQPDKGDLVLAVRGDGEWDIDTAADDGHDGWDSTVVVGDDGVVRAAGVDPAQFQSEEGVEYYELTDGGWEITAIGTGPVEYEWNVSLDVGPAGEPALTYFDHVNQDLVFASLEGETWSLETVDSEGDVGRFSSLAVDTGGTAHISYYQADTSTVRYATNAGGAWSVEDVATLDAVEIGFTGARRITDIDIDSAGIPRIAFTDTAVVRLATGDEAGWTVEEVAAAGPLPLGQLVSLELDDADVPHIATYEVTAPSPLNGVIVHLTQG
jgi:hypothetical protein